jgi:hypothetical protein
MPGDALERRTGGLGLPGAAQEGIRNCPPAAMRRAPGVNGLWSGPSRPQLMGQAGLLSRQGHGRRRARKATARGPATPAGHGRMRVFQLSYGSHRRSATAEAGHTRPGPPRRSRPRALATAPDRRSPRPPLHRRAGGQAEAASAGSQPKPRLRPNAARALHDTVGGDIAAQRPPHADTVAGRRFDHLISLCDKARETSPDFPGHPRRAHWSIPDPRRRHRPGQLRLPRSGPTSSGAHATPPTPPPPGATASR